MARQTVKTTTVKTKTRQRKTGGKSGYKQCPNCGGDGRVKIKKKK